MLRVVLLCAVAALALSAVGAADSRAPQPLRVPSAAAIAPMVIVRPLRGIVTLVEPYGQFYTNVGAKESLCNGAEILVVRGGAVVAHAQVIKVNVLDSIAELLPEYRMLLPESGDVVVVQCNPTQPSKTRNAGKYPPAKSDDTDQLPSPPAGYRTGHGYPGIPDLLWRCRLDRARVGTGERLRKTHLVSYTHLAPRMEADVHAGRSGGIIMSNEQPDAAHPQVGDRLIVTIDTLAAGGDGIARPGGFTVFVPHSAPGDVAEIEITGVTKNYGRARLLALQQPGPTRVPTTCPLAEGCPGCPLQHLSYPAQLAAKEQFIRDGLERIGRLKGVEVRPTLGMDDPWRYRNKGEFAAQRIDGAPAVGISW